MFENDVEMYGAQTALKGAKYDNGFENDVEMYGAQTLVRSIQEKTDIRDTVNSAIAQFGISGKYASSKETDFKNGWYTKTDK